MLNQTEVKLYKNWEVATIYFYLALKNAEYESENKDCFILYKRFLSSLYLYM